MRRLVVPVLLGFLAVAAAYVALILAVLAVGGPINDLPRNRLSEWLLAVLAAGVAVALGLGVLKALRRGARS